MTRRLPMSRATALLPEQCSLLPPSMGGEKEDAYHMARWKRCRRLRKARNGKSRYVKALGSKVVHIATVVPLLSDIVALR